VKRLQVRVTDGTSSQILDQVLYIAADSTSNALAWETRLRATLECLSDFHGHVIDEEVSRRLGYTTHKLVFERTYVLHYHVDLDAGFVYVVNFRHGARLSEEQEI
jgi:plasmid stabilization system protein ParE